ncbi:HupE/UreJ family protein [Plantactinospora sp. ZYX-F-223]|uniref:HupE/UreJ family protein n=1 Tax=Plantactinospora sp. ZYX-F-223 TaxID=3144103 RepID=UPI0031FCD160
MAAGVRRGILISATAGTLLLAAPGAAFAHGIGGSSESVPGFVWLGFTHMLLGWDHLLFVGGILLLAGQVRRAAKLISLFALGHSITLFTATVAAWHVNPTLVDVIVALSLVFVGVVGLIGRPSNWTWFGASVFGFGLIHGLGLATRLQDLGLPSDGLIPRVLAFNLGVELGQLLAVVAMFMIGDVLRHYIPKLRQTRLSHGALIAAGLIAAPILLITAGGEPPAQAVGSCQVRERTETYPFGEGHPDKDFFEPGEQVPGKAFGHVIGDGYVIVHYQPDLPADQLAQVRAFVTDSTNGKVVGGPATGQAEMLKAVHAYNTITCTSLDLPALKQFTTGWFADPRSKPPSD